MTYPVRTSEFEMNRSTIISLLYVASFLVGITSIIGVVLAYVWNGEAHESWEDSHYTPLASQRCSPGEAHESWEDSHYRYHIRTFWIGMVWGVAALAASVATLFLLAWVFFPLVAVWFVARAIKALLAAQKHEPVANVTTWLV